MTDLVSATGPKFALTGSMDGIDMNNILSLYSNDQSMAQAVLRAMNCCFWEKDLCQRFHPKMHQLKAFLTVMKYSGDFQIQYKVVELLMLRDDVTDFKEWFGLVWFEGMPNTIKEFTRLKPTIGNCLDPVDACTFLWHYNQESPLQYVYSIRSSVTSWNNTAIPPPAKGVLMFHMNCGTKTFSISGVDQIPPELEARKYFVLKSSEIKTATVNNYFTPCNSKAQVLSITSSKGHLTLHPDPLIPVAVWLQIAEFFLFISNVELVILQQAEIQADINGNIKTLQACQSIENPQASDQRETKPAHVPNPNSTPHVSSSEDYLVVNSQEMDNTATANLVKSLETNNNPIQQECSRVGRSTPAGSPDESCMDFNPDIIVLSTSQPQVNLGDSCNSNSNNVLIKVSPPPQEDKIIEKAESSCSGSAPERKKTWRGKKPSPNLTASRSRKVTTKRQSTNLDSSYQNSSPSASDAPVSRRETRSSKRLKELDESSDDLKQVIDTPVRGKRRLSISSPRLGLRKSRSKSLAAESPSHDQRHSEIEIEAKSDPSEEVSSQQVTSNPSEVVLSESKVPQSGPLPSMPSLTPVSSPGGPKEHPNSLPSLNTPCPSPHNVKETPIQKLSSPDPKISIAAEDNVSPVGEENETLKSNMIQENGPVPESFQSEPVGSSCVKPTPNQICQVQVAPNCSENFNINYQFQIGMNGMELLNCSSDSSFQEPAPSAVLLSNKPMQDYVHLSLSDTSVCAPLGNDQGEISITDLLNPVSSDV